jgi:putative transposase
MLTAIEFREYCSRLGFPASTVELIQKIRTSSPSRRVASDLDNVSGIYPSEKNGFGVQFESHTSEFPFIYKLESNPNALEYYCQPPPIPLDYECASGKRLVVWHTPDYFVLWSDRAGWVEAKPENKLLVLANKTPNRYQLVAERWVCPPGAAYAEPLSLCYEVHSSAYISSTFVRNAQFLDEFWRDSTPVSSSSMEAVSTFMARNPVTKLDDLLLETKDTVPSDDIYQMLAKRILHFDWDAALLIEPERVHIFADAEACIQFHASVNRNPVDGGVIQFQTGGQLLWDGKSWEVLNVGMNNVTLLNDDKHHVDVPSTVIEELVKQNRISYTSAAAEEHRDVALMLQQASDEDLRIANQRARFVEDVRSAPSRKKPRLTRTQRRDVQKFEQAQHDYGNGYVGLLPKTRLKGNRTHPDAIADRDDVTPVCGRHLDDETIKAMSKSIEDFYEVLEQPTIYRCWATFKKERKSAKLPYPGLTTYRLAVRARSMHEQVLKRKGRRAAYSTEEYYWTLDEQTPVHGDRPFEIGHIDHTQLDVELAHKIPGMDSERPWLTTLVDAFSRRILAKYLTFDKPSYRSCMMVLRECVRRHQRLPQIIIVDGGPEFRSVYFDHLLARYQKTKKVRPRAKSRFGSVCERIFGTINTEFIYNLRGNTQITKNVRLTTKSNNPKNRAVWDFASLQNDLDYYCYEVYDTKVHQALGTSPRDVFLRGMQSGNRLRSLIPYDLNFRMATCPTTRTGKATVHPGRGVTIGYFNFWCESFRNPKVQNTKVSVRYDPWDAAVAWAYVNGQWMQCHSKYHAILKGRTEREIQLATRLLREQMQSQGQARATINAAKLAAFLTSTKQHEELLTQRARDSESECARDPHSDAAAPGLSEPMPVLDPLEVPKVAMAVDTAPKSRRKIALYPEL